MVFKTGLDYGFNAFSVSNVPRAPRSIRRRGRTKRSVEDTQICAFELLASLAGKLLEESEGSASSNASKGHDHVSIGKDVKLEIGYDVKQLKTEYVEHLSCRGSVVASDVVSEQIKGDLKSSICKGNVVYGSFPDNKLDDCSPNSGELCDGIIKNGVKRERVAKGLESGALDIANTCPEKDPLELSMTFPAPINSDRDVKMPPRCDSVPVASFSRHRNDIKLGSRDDDEKISRFNKLSNRFKASRTATRFEDQRIRKLIKSKYWKASPKLKDFEHSKADGGIKPLNHKRKYDKCQYDTLYKRRKFFERSTIVTSDRGVGTQSVTNSPERVMKENKSSSLATSNRACEISSLLTGHQASHKSNDSHVKFSIKSFRIPELYIEVPENVTVGSLKRTVMEAVTALLGDRIRVGVLLQGKKVKDDSRTLLQTGISCEDNLDALGFTLEPGLTIAPPPICSEEPHLLLSSSTVPQNFTSSLTTRAGDIGVLDATPEPSLLTKSAKPVDSNQNLSECRALVPVSAMNVEALAVVPVQKTRKSELAQRRTRRPFSVSEVEALVHAVEELGTGRWRDVKLRAFENSDHRTYVDLKDKWKTLVHTAKISPQQRRGEPVPQELLDRVMAAHAYWSQHQAKQQGKHNIGTLRITDS